MRIPVKVPFEVVMSFAMPNNALGVVIRQVTRPEIHQVLLADDMFGGKPVGTIFDVECEQLANDSLRYPANLESAWSGPIGNSAKQIESRYLQYLYLVGLQGRIANEVASEGQVPTAAPKSFDPKDVFATPILVLFETLYKTIHGQDIKEVLAKIDFYYNKRSYFTRFNGDDAGITYRTPRALRYYPEYRTVAVAFVLENDDNVPKNILPENLAAKFRGDVHLIQRFYTNTSWLSLRDLCKKDTNVWGIISGFIDRGFIKPVDLSKTK